jgi:hypothetical protein
MKIVGGCYCGAVRYEINGEPQASLQCHCRECQYISGGNPALLMIFPLEGFQLVSGEMKQFRRPDLDRPVTRHFCENCGTGIASVFKPAVAIYTCDKQDYHHIPEDIPAFDKRPG